MTFEPGQFAICIDAKFAERQTPLVCGAIYEIRRTGPGYPNAIGQHASSSTVFLCEVSNPHTSLGDFAASRFRPLKDSAIDIFRSMLTNIPAEEVNALNAFDEKDAVERIEAAAKAVHDDLVKVERSWRT